MKELYWKEYRENRMLPVTALITYLTLLLLNTAFDKFLEHHPTDFSSNVAIFALTMLIFFLAAAAPAFANETGSGTLQFLSVLPVSRGRVWWLKASAALAAALAAFVLVFAVWLLISDFAFHSDFVKMFFSTRPITWSDKLGELEMVVATIIALTTLFTMGLCASPFFDRSISAIFSGFVVGIFYVAFAIDFLQRIGVDRTFAKEKMTEHGTATIVHADVFPKLIFQIVALAALCLAPLIITSYVTFTRGESLQTAYKYKVGGATAVISMGCAMLIAFLGHSAQIW